MGNTRRLILLLFMPLTVKMQSFECPMIKDMDNNDKETVQIGNRCYWFGAENVYLQWLDAYDWCESRGGHLVKFETAEEEENVTNYISQEFTNAEEFWTSGKCPDPEKIDSCNDQNNWLWITSVNNGSGDVMEYSNWHPDEPNPGDNFQEKSICLILRKHDITDEWGWYDENYDEATSIICEFDQVPSTTTTRPTYTSKSSIEPSTSKDRSTPQTDGLSTDVVSSSTSSEGFSTQSSLTMTTINPASSRNNALLIGLTVPFSVLIVTTLIVIAFVLIKRRKTRSDDKGTMDNDVDGGSMIDVKNVAYESVMNLSPVTVDDEHDTKRNHSAEQNIYTQHDMDDTGVFIGTQNVIYEPFDTTGDNEESKTVR